MQHLVDDPPGPSPRSLTAATAGGAARFGAGFEVAATEIAEVQGASGCVRRSRMVAR